MSTPATLPESRPADFAWKEELRARLREHQQRRAGAAAATQPVQDRAEPSALAARVAARYREAPSYQEVLARSAAAAAVAAEAARMAAEAAEEAGELLAGWKHGQPPRLGNEENAPEALAAPLANGRNQAGEEVPAPAQLPVEAAVAHPVPLPPRTGLPARPSGLHRARALVDAFAEMVVPAAQHLPAKLIEFPRELVAPRKQRPRLAEGPLLDEKPSAAVLRIFEVEAGFARGDGSAVDGPAEREQIASAGAYGDGQMVSRGGMEHEGTPRRGGFEAPPDTEAPTPPAVGAESGWASIRLGEHPEEERAPEPEQPGARRIEYGYKAQTVPALHDLAPLSHRLMAGLVDGGLVFGCFLLAVLLFSTCTLHMPAGKTALVLALLVFGALATFYGWLFMSFGGGSTPGMRYAHIALCTFADENPTRKEMQNRVGATALALLPAGLGLLWALLDENKLGWHDRMTRTYQRSYR